MMFECNSFPSLLKSSDVLPIYKKGDVKDPSNYRPIAILHNLSKVFEKVILDRMFSFINKFDILANCQFGFRPRYSTKDAVMYLLLLIESNSLNKLSTCVIFLDLTKAFDYVNHSTLVSTLSSLGFRGKISILLQDYLSGRRFRIKHDNTYTDYVNINRGVPQGSILGPLLYALYVNDMTNFLPCNIVQYADDTSLVISFNCLSDLTTSLNLVQNKLIGYLDSKNLILNKSKTNIMIFGDSHIKSINFLDNQINISDEVSFLGIKLDKKLSFSAHIDKVCYTIKRMYSNIYFVRNILDRNTKRLFFYSYIFPHIIYSIPFILNANQGCIDKLNVTYKSAIKILYKYPRQFASESLHQITGIPTLDTVIKVHCLIYAYKIFTHHTPPIICSFYVSTPRHNFILHTHTNTRSLHNQICLTWNSLSASIRSLPSLFMFKKAVMHNS